MIRKHSRQHRFVIVAAALVSVLSLGVVAVEQSKRQFDVSAKRYAFTVAGNDAAEIRVNQNELVHIVFAADDIAHSFTIDDAPYRIMKRAEPGKPVSFDFRADAPGRFRFFCSLTVDPKCKDMHGTLVVEPAR